MTEIQTISATIEILGKLYPVRCLESELSALKQAAEYLNEQMQAIRESGKVINLERIAIIAALNIANEFLSFKQQKNSMMSKINERLSALQTKVDDVVSPNQREMIYALD